MSQDVNHDDTILCASCSEPVEEGEICFCDICDAAVCAGCVVGNAATMYAYCPTCADDNLEG